MAASFDWAIVNGSGTITVLGTSGNLCNFQSQDTNVAADYVTNTINAGNNSFELWLKAYFHGTFNRIDGLRFWQSTNFSPSTGLQVYWKGTQQIFLTPTANTSSIATDSIPVANPGTTNVTIGGSLTSSLVANGYSDHIVMQLRTTTSAAAGDTSLMVATCSYLEN